MPAKKKNVLDYSTDNTQVGLRLIIENSKDNHVSFFTMDEKGNNTVFASLFMSAAEVKNSALVVRDKRAGLDFYLSSGDKLFIGFVQQPDLGLDPDDEDDPDKVRALPKPKSKPINQFLLLSIIPNADLKEKRSIDLPELIIHRDALGTKDPVCTGPQKVCGKEDPEKSFAWGMIHNPADGQTAVLSWITCGDVPGTLDLNAQEGADPVCRAKIEFPKRENGKECAAKTFAIGFFPDSKTALSNCKKTIISESRIKIESLH
ncbi:MAG: hypothetical protein Q4G69_09100 [Planctomycetia bacterium]|nr:hypothetical protein [Planctomycetia bacterium]